MLKRALLVLAISANTLLAGSINIAVAANVSYAIDELISEFNKTQPDTKVQVTLGSSGKLTAQIKNGSPYEMFMAANMDYPKALYQENIAITKPFIYAQGSLAMLSDRKQDFSQGIALIKSNKIEKIAIANPKTAPYGIAAVEAMKNAGYYTEIENKFVYAESISQTVAYTVTAADMGFIAKSSMYSSKMQQYKKGEQWEEVDPKLYTPIDQGVVMLKGGSKEAREFYDFIISDEAKTIFQKYGYLVP